MRLAHKKISKNLKRYGPGLVSGFAVTDDFLSNECQHLGNYKVCQFKGLHAMVLVGYRVVDGQYRYLLQNWWKLKPYVEVDAGYLISSQATINFITNRQMEMGKFPTNLETVVECELDASENYMLEG
jgi:hypothetical protein